MKRHTLTPDEWLEDGRTTAHRNGDDGWWTINTGFVTINIHEDEIAELYRVVFDKETNDEN